MKPIAEAVVARWFTPGFRKRNAQTVAAVKQLLLAANPGGYAATCGAIRDMDFRGEVGAITTPTLVIVGRDDPVTTPDDAKFLVDAIEGAWGKVLDAAHLSNVEQPATFNDAVLKFLMA
jgi:3-oxoadipate enol-lactonase